MGTHTIEEQMERFARIEEEVEVVRREHSNLEARFELQREQYTKKREELAEKGITFKTGKELKEVHEEKSRRVEELLAGMEKALGFGEAEDEDDYI